MDTWWDFRGVTNTTVEKAGFDAEKWGLTPREVELYSTSGARFSNKEMRKRALPFRRNRKNNNSNRFYRN